MKAMRLIIVFLLLLDIQVTWAQHVSKNTGTHNVSLTVTDKNSKEAMIMANCALEPLGAANVTDIDGKVSFRKVPSGTFTLKVTYVATKPTPQR